MCQECHHCCSAYSRVLEFLFLLEGVNRKSDNSMRPVLVPISDSGSAVEAKYSGDKRMEEEDSELKVVDFPVNR